MTRREIDLMTSGFAPVIRTFVRKEIDTLASAIGAAIGQERILVREELNSIRARLDMPLLKAPKERVRVPYTRGETW